MLALLHNCSACSNYFKPLAILNHKTKKKCHIYLLGVFLHFREEVTLKIEIAMAELVT